MAVLTPADLRKQIRKKEFAPVYLLFGPEKYQRDLAARTLSDHVLRDSGVRSFNEAEFLLNSSPIRSALAAAEQLPMMTERRVVTVSGIIVSTNHLTCNLKEDSETLLASYLESPSETTVLILVADELDKRLKMSRLILDHSSAVEFKRLEEGELKKWVRDRFHELEVHADEKAVHHLVALVGEDLGKLKLELEKLVIAAYPDKQITYELVDSLVPASRELTNFILTDHLLSNRKTPALQVLKEILDNGAEPLMLLGLIGSSFRKMMLASEMIDEGRDEREVRSTLNVPWKTYQQIIGIARRTDREKFRRILVRLSEADLAIKTSRATPRLQIEMLVCELATLH